MENWMTRLRLGAFPPACLACGLALAPREAAFCEACAVGLLEAPGGTLALGDGRRVPARALWYYGGPLRDALLRVKHQPSVHGARLLAEALAAALPCPPGEAGVLVPVPSTTWHLLRRGFSPATLLTEGLAGAWGWPLAPALGMGLLGRSQAGRGGAQRRDNGRLRLRRGRARALVGRRVLVVDDVAATGSTLREAAGLVLEAGAASVELLALAVVEELPWVREPQWPL